MAFLLRVYREGHVGSREAADAVGYAMLIWGLGGITVAIAAALVGWQVGPAFAFAIGAALFFANLCLMMFFGAYNVNRADNEQVAVMRLQMAESPSRRHATFLQDRTLEHKERVVSGADLLLALLRERPHGFNKFDAWGICAKLFECDPKTLYRGAVMSELVTPMAEIGLITSHPSTVMYLARMVPLLKFEPHAFEVADALRTMGSEETPSSPHDT